MKDIEFIPLRCECGGTCTRSGMVYYMSPLLYGYKCDTCKYTYKVLATEIVPETILKRDELPDDVELDMHNLMGEIRARQYYVWAPYQVKIRDNKKEL